MEEVILVNENDEQIGSMEKMEAHRKAVLHRAFSIFIVNSNEEMLLQQRALHKYHSGGLWTNACCSHPRPGETTIEAAERRLQEEMGFTTNLEKIFHFSYKSHFENGLTENEFDHVLLGKYDGFVNINTDEVNEYEFKSFPDIKELLLSHPEKYTVWFHIAFPKVLAWYNQNML